MTNWEREVSRIKNTQQVEENSRREIQKQEQAQKERFIQEQTQNDYDNIVIPGFKVLDSFNIKETLIEIRDQVWKVGKISKEPNSFEEYKKNRSEQIGIKEAAYKLISPKFLGFSPGIDGYDNDSSSQDEVGEITTSLTISSDGEYINIEREKIKISEKNHSEIQKIINEILVKDCMKRRDYSKIDPIVFNHPVLLQRYYDEKSRQNPKRSFLDKLFG
ncbi:MAG: hypothetical protein PHO75_02150 [Candidatus Shapirobacteria bacterium]|nr:hypothetical protein [Candidatus Shapirobacteria bacterium]